MTTENIRNDISNNECCDICYDDECDNDSLIVLKCCNDSKKMWGENMKQMDEKFKIWSNAPEDPQNN